jgi:predicted amidohydrolase
MSPRRRIRPIEAAVVAAALALAGLGWARSFPNTYRVAAVQMHSRTGDLSFNRAHMEDLARRAAATGARVIVFPEAAVTGYVSEDFEVWTDPVERPGEGRSLQNYAEPADGKSVSRFAALARELGAYIVVPFVEYDRAGRRYFNTLVAVGPRGRVRAHYRKLNPWPRAEATWATPGDKGLVWVDTEYGRLGLLICYDIHSVARRLAEAGCDTLLYSVAWVGRPGMWFEEHLPAIADGLDVNIVAANWTFPPESPLCEPGYGYSRVIDSRGQVLAAAGEELGEEIVLADLPVGEPPNGHD